MGQWLSEICYYMWETSRFKCLPLWVLFPCDLGETDFAFVTWEIGFEAWGWCKQSLVGTRQDGKVGSEVNISKITLQCIDGWISKLILVKRINDGNDLIVVKGGICYVRQVNVKRHWVDTLQY